MAVSTLSGGYQLPASKWLSNMTTLINNIRTHKNLTTTSKMNEIIDSVRDGNVDFGKGILNRFILAPQKVKDLAKTSSLLEVEEPAIGEEIITIDKYKTAKVSLNEIVSKDSFLEGQGFNTFLSEVSSILETTKNIYLYNEAKDLYLNWVPGQVTQTITIDLISEEGHTGSDLKAIKELNASTIAKKIRLIMNNMKTPSSIYTDSKQYTDPNDGEMKDVVTSIEQEPSFMINDVFYSNYLADAKASLYHGEEVGNMLPGKVKVMPEASMGEQSQTTIGWLYQDKKFALADFYNLEFSFFDGSNLYNHLMLHFSYGCGVFKYMPGVKLVAQYA